MKEIRYVIAKAVEHGWCDETRTFTFEPLLTLPVGHHHVTVNEDGTYTAVPMRPHMRKGSRVFDGSLATNGVFHMRAPIDDLGRVLWLDAPVEGA